jgi:capsular exopolysaccharide synthesis family protein
MGRVFEALRRAGTAPKVEPGAVANKESERRRPGRADVPSAEQVEEQLLKSSSIMSALSNVSNSSAPTAHTADVTDGSALPGGMASRDAGATLGAARATRVGGFVSYDISPTHVEPHLVAISQPRSAYCEQFRSLRTRILQAGERLKMRAFVITSAGIGEGKTLTSVNLAWLLAQSEGVRALLIDSDLRQPCVADYLGIDSPVGLSEILGGKATLEESILRLEPAGLYLLPGGAPRDDVAELLTGPTYAKLLTDARRLFDFVIIDAPPLGVFSDANVLISRADGALLVVRAGKTRYSTVDKLLDHLPRESVLGVVLNSTDEEMESNLYYYRRNYYRRDNGLQSVDAKVLPEANDEVISIN